MRTASAPYPRYRWIAALTLAAVVVGSAVTIKDDAAANLPPAAGQLSRANPPSRPAAVVNDSSSRNPVASQARLLAEYGKLPLSFEINQGQTDRRVNFLSRGSGYSLFLTSNEAVLTLRKGSPPSTVARRRAATGCRLEVAGCKSAGFIAARAVQHDVHPMTSVLHMRLVGANAKATVTGLEELPGTSNYFIGNDRRQWRTNVPNYARVKYSNVYQGVDVVYYGNQRQLEYDFVVEPGANPQQIELSFDGAKRLRLDADGDLIVSMAGGEVIEHKPVIYQDIHGTRRRVAGGYTQRNGHTAGFKLASYDHRRSLTIDPSLEYSTYLGGSNFDQGSRIALDSLGNAFVTGDTNSNDFPSTAGAFQTASGGKVDAFVSKLNSTGSALVYSTYLGGSSYDYGFGIAVDSSGNAYATGLTTSSDFPTTAGAFQTTFGGGGGDAFVSKLNSSGSAVVYSTYLGGTNYDYGYGVALDSSGNAYLAGGTYSSDFPTTAGALETALSGPEDIFVSKLNGSGSALVYSTYLGGSLQDGGLGIALDSLGDAYITGYTNSSDFPTTPGAFQTTNSSFNLDAFIGKLNRSGSALVYSTYLGGSHGNQGNSIALDSSGNAYVTGYTYSSDFPTTPGAFQTTYGGDPYDAFVSKLNGSGSALVYSTYLGGSGVDQGNGIALDASGNAYVAGSTGSSNFPTTAGAFQTSLRGSEAAFVTRLNSSGSALMYSTYLGGSLPDYGGGIALDSSGNFYVSGTATSRNFPTTAGAFQTTYGGGRYGDAFVSKFSSRPSIPFSRFGGSLLIDPDTGVFYLSGGFTLGAGGSIDPTKEFVTFSVGSYSVTLPPGTFVKYKTGYVYQKTVNHIFLCVFIKFSNSPGSYALLANRIGGTLTSTTSPVPVTLAIGNDSGMAQMKAKFN